MHEGNFTKQIVDAITSQLKTLPDESPSEVTVRVGETFHLVKESVLFHYEALTKGSALERIKLNIIEIPMKIQCQKCQWLGHPEDHHLPLCQKCGGLEVDIKEGDQVLIEKFN